MICRPSPFQIQRICRCRTLPQAGKVLARIGKVVQPHDIVAEAMLTSGYVILDAAKALGCSEDEWENVLQVGLGSLVNEGDLLASKRVMLFEKHLISPCAGKVKWIECGKIWIEKSEEVYALQAGYSGKIVDILLDRGVVVEAEGRLCLGVWGNQRFGFGRIGRAEEGVRQSLDEADIGQRNRGEILFAHTCKSPAVFQKAEKLTIGGLVFSSLPAEMIMAAQKTSVPVLVLEGFGDLAPVDWMNHWMENAEGKMGVMNTQRDFSQGERGEIFCSEPAVENEVVSSAAASDLLLKAQRIGCLIEAGQSVKILFSGNHGQMGIVKEIMPNTYANGIRRLSAEILTDKNTRLVVPLDNIEVIY